MEATTANLTEKAIDALHELAYLDRNGLPLNTAKRRRALVDSVKVDTDWTDEQVIQQVARLV